MTIPGVAVQTFSDPYEYQTFTCDAQHRVVVTGPGTYRARTTRIDLRHVVMRRAWQSLPAISHLDVPEGRSVICFPTNVQDRTGMWGGMEVPLGDIFFAYSGGEFYNRVEVGGHWASISLSTAALTAFAEAIGGHDLLVPASPQNVIRPRIAAMSRLLALHQAAGTLAENAPDILAGSEVGKAIEDKLLEAVLDCLSEPADVEIRKAARRSVLSRFEELLEANPDRPLHIVDVCTAIGVAGRTLRQHCMEHLGMSPHRYLWLRRMNQVRRTLALADARSRTVTDIAMQFGFWELGRFSMAYRKLFGELPSTTLRRNADASVAGTSV